jgi:hypothetical protein
MKPRNQRLFPGDQFNRGRAAVASEPSYTGLPGGNQMDCGFCSALGGLILIP